MKDDSHIFYTCSETVFGSLLVASVSRGVVFSGFPKTKRAGLLELSKRFPGKVFEERKTAYHRAVLAWTKRSPHAVQAKIPVVVSGTLFQEKVWQTLSTIPRGETMTYAELAKKIGHPRAVRAVGTAVGANPVALLIPCHRIVPMSGGVGKYHWGEKRKAELLRAEGVKI